MKGKLQEFKRLTGTGGCKCSDRVLEEEKNGGEREKGKGMRRPRKATSDLKKKKWGGKGKGRLYPAL